MTNETLRMQFLSGVITEGQYKIKLQENKKKKSLNESMIGGIVGIGAINQIPPRAKADYETAFEHFLGKKYGLNEEMEVMVDSNMLKSYFNELISLADDMEYTPEMVDELKNLKNTLQGGKISVENALDLMQQTVDITEDDIDAVEALSQAVDNDDAIIDKAREIYGLDEGKKVKIEEGAFNDLLNKMESNTRMAADILTVITLAKEDKEGNAEKAVELLMKNHDLSEEAALEAVTHIFKKAFEWVDSMEEGKKVKIEEGRNDWWVKADEELGLDFDGENLEDLAMNADESWQADFAQQVLDIDASDYEDYKNQVSAIYDETNPF